MNRRRLIEELIRVEMLYQESKKLKKNKKLLREGADGNRSFWDSVFNDELIKIYDKLEILDRQYDQIKVAIESNLGGLIKNGYLNLKVSDRDKFGEVIQNLITSYGDLRFLNQTFLNDFFDTNLKGGSDFKLNLAHDKLGDGAFKITGKNSESISNLWNLYSYFKTNNQSLFTGLCFGIMKRLSLKWFKKLGKTATENVVGSEYDVPNPVLNIFVSKLSERLKDAGLIENQIVSILSAITNEKDLDQGAFNDLFSFPFFQYTEGDIQNSDSQLFKDLNDRLRKNYYSRKVYDLTEKPGSSKMGPGRGEFLLLSMLDGFKSGGGRKRDLISDSGLEVELKQIDSKGRGNESLNSFNVYLKANKKSTVSVNNFFNELNNFLNRFAENTLSMNELFKLTDNLQTIAFKDTLLNVDKSGGDNTKFYDGNLPDKVVNALFGLDDKRYGTLNTSPNDNTATNEFVLRMIQLSQQSDKAPKSKPLARSMAIENENPLKTFFDVFNVKTPEQLNKLKQQPKHFIFNKIGDTTHESVYNPSNEFHKKNPDLFMNSFDLWEKLNNYVKGFNIYNDEIIFKSKINAEEFNELDEFFFSNIITKYGAALNTYDKFLDEFIISLNKLQDADRDRYYNLYKDLKNKLKQTDSKISASDPESFGELKDKEYQDLLKYKIFLQFSEEIGMGDEELIVTFKHLDADKNVKNIKKVVNYIDPNNQDNSEFKIIEPTAITSIDDFFNSSRDANKPVTIQLNDDQLSHDMADKVISSKKLFSFLNMPMNVEKINDFEIQTPNLDVESIKSNVNIIGALDRLISSLIEVHKEIQQEYTDNAMLILSDAGAADKATYDSYKIAFSNKNIIDYDSIRSEEAFNRMIAQKKCYFATTVNNGNVVLHIANESVKTDVLLNVLLKIRGSIFNKIKEQNDKKKSILEKIKKIKSGMIKNLQLKKSADILNQ